MALIKGDPILASEYNALIAGWDVDDEGKVLYSGFVNLGFGGEIETSFWVRSSGVVNYHFILNNVSIGPGTFTLELFNYTDLVTPVYSSTFSDLLKDVTQSLSPGHYLMTLKHEGAGTTQPALSVKYFPYDTEVTVGEQIRVFNASFSDVEALEVTAELALDGRLTDVNFEGGT